MKFESLETAVDVFVNTHLWQENEFVHPLTCGVDSRHENLVPVLKLADRDVSLKCRTCGYVQDWIPECVNALAASYAMLDPLFEDQ